MKTKLFLIPFLIFLIMSGCSSAQSVKPQLENIKFTSQIQCYNEEYVCDMTLTKDGIYATVVEPQEINGLVFFYNDDEFYAEYLGIKYTPKINAMPMGNVVTILSQVLTKISSQDCETKYSDDNCVIEGKYNSDRFLFYFSPQGLPLSLEIPNKNFKVNFENVTVLQQEKATD